MKDKISKKTDTKQIISQKSIPTKNQQDIFDESPIIIPDDNLLIVNSWGRAVPQPKPTIIFKKEVYGKAGAWTLIKAKTGAGKTSFIEVIASAYLGQLEIMGITCQMYDGKTKIMIVDTEQTESESQDSYDRIWKRIGCKKDKDNPPDNVNKLIHIGLKRFANDTNRMFNIIEQTIKENNNSIGLIILDVGSDFCPEVNNEGDVNKLIKWLCKFNEKVTIVITWHINEGVDGQKSGGDTARGHGKSLERKCSYTLQLSMDDETGIGTITAKKNRKGEKPKLNYIYDKELQYFVETDQTPNVKSDAKEIAQLKEIAQEVFAEKAQATYGDLLGVIEKNKGVKEKRAKQIIPIMLSKAIINKVAKNVYELV